MEKKYVLGKDLPMAKKGEEVRFNEASLRFEVFDRGYSGEWVSFAPAILQNLLDEGWIEEVKPLEIWVNEYATPTQHPTEHLGEYSYTDFKKAQEAAQYSGSYIRTVHFIEAEETK